MVWFIGFLVLIIGAYATGYRKVAIGLVAAALVGGAVLYFYNRQEEQAALARIAPAELVFEKVTLTPYVGSYKIAGRIRNNSPKFTLRQVDLTVTVRDCPGAGAQECVPVGESNEILNVNVPPGEARDFEEAVRFYGSSPRLKGRMEWAYSVSRIRGE